MERQRVASGSPFEDQIGFSRAVRVGKHVFVSGTAPIWPDGRCDSGADAQTRRCLTIIAQALQQVGAGLEHVVRTRMYVIDPSDAMDVGRAHADTFGAIRPAATMIVVARLLDPRWRVEIEAEAIIL